MYVKNVAGSDSLIPPQGYNSWLEFWKDHARVYLKKCSATDCDKDAEVGAHVQKAYSDDENYYIIPLCKICKRRNDVYEIPDYVTMVPSPNNL
ncbi:MAG: hypothetical protein LKI53_08825 [Bacteroidales bacterium]|jgi:hypothetical protein|nr:hypothetical protein [Bacteroidales bacterium]